MKLSFERALHHRHGPFALAAIAALLSIAPASIWIPHLGIDIPNIVFYITYLVVVFIHLPDMTGEYLKKRAANDDAPAPVIIVVTLLTVVVAIVALFVVLHHKTDAGLAKLILAFGSVVAGWATIHTMAAIHYAHMYWRPDRQAGGDGVAGGLDFPGVPQPGGYDFLCFAFGIGMTAQTGDIAITSSVMRRRNLLHAVFSYFFNTVLLAAAVSGAVALFA
ncbi:DUF1345 domain-containing protein [Martelella radicis]|uniref:Putative membrane protein n=1 Tax=Martelella radicis TaxID=1397476 RepID=A0A7W6P8J5_9HYPH|nr:DUF1345 domain-containing protein [Martelella radicis]MBB4120401.1 putative membrane protein [Martelella radicis]